MFALKSPASDGKGRKRTHCGGFCVAAVILLIPSKALSSTCIFNVCLFEDQHVDYVVTCISDIVSSYILN